MLVRESINFKRGLSDSEIKTQLFGWRRGQILRIFNSGLIIYIEKINNNIIKTLVFGYFFWDHTRIEIHSFKYKDLILRNIRSEKIEDLFELKGYEIEMLNKALNDPKNKEYINNIKETIGVTPFA